MTFVVVSPTPIEGEIEKSGVSLCQWSESWFISVYLISQRYSIGLSCGAMSFSRKGR